jgi:hypothetical protein
MDWFWLNIPLAVVFVAVYVGVPLWLVVRHPDEEPRRSAARAPTLPRPAAGAGPQAACLPEHHEDLVGV